MNNSSGMSNLMKAGILLVAAIFLTSTIGVTATMQPQQKNSTVRADDILINEGFEGGVVTPPGWTKVVSNPDFTWKIINDYPHSGTYAAQCPRSNNAQDEWLTSPEVDLTYYYAAGIVFWVNTTITGAPGMNVDLVVRGDGIDDIVWSVVSEVDWTTYAWREVSVDLSAYATKIITVSWHYYGEVGKKNFALDDIVFSGTPLTPPPTLQIGEISGGFKATKAINVEIINANNETGDDGINVIWSITAIGNGILKKINVTANGTIPLLEHNGGLEVVQCTGLMGVAMLNITVRADIPDNPRVVPVEKSVDGFLFLLWVFVTE